MFSLTSKLNSFKPNYKGKVGFIGLGQMGSRMVTHLKDKCDQLFVYDVVPESVEALVSSNGALAGATKCDSVADVAKNCDVVLTMLPASKHVQGVYTEMIPHLKKGAFCVDSSTIDPSVIADISKTAKEHEITVIDAPVSGGVGGAEMGTLTFMVGAEDEQFEAAEAFLDPMAKAVVHCGATGTGQAAKLSNNLVLSMHMIGISEGMNLGIKLGIKPEKLANIFNMSTARCWSGDTYNPYPGIIQGVPSSNDYNGGFGAKLMKKDLGLALNAASEVSAQTKLGERAKEIYDRMSEGEMQDKDFSGVFKLIQENKE